MNYLQFCNYLQLIFLSWILGVYYNLYNKICIYFHVTRSYLCTSVVCDFPGRALQSDTVHIATY